MSYIENTGYFLRYLTNTILKFDAVFIRATVERSFKLSNKKYASYVQKTPIVSCYDTVGEVVEFFGNCTTLRRESLCRRIEITNPIAEYRSSEWPDILGDVGRRNALQSPE